MSTKRAGLGRREFVSAAGLAAGLAATTGTARALWPLSGHPDTDAGEGADATRRSPAAPESDPAVRALFGDLTAGSPLGRCSVEAIHPIRMGAIPVVLRTGAGRRFQVDVLRRDRRDGGRLGVANTEGLSLFVANRGDGRTATDEEQGLGAMALAEVLARRQAVGAPAPALLTMDERRARHPVGGYSVLP